MQHLTKEQQDKIITSLVTSMCQLQEALEPLGLRTDDISYANDLYDAIEVLYFKREPDGDQQQRFFDDMQSGEEPELSFEEAKTCLVVRICNLAETETPSVATIVRF
jgi:hypothetical protein